jgi:hypothetical protein
MIGVNFHAAGASEPTCHTLAMVCYLDQHSALAGLLGAMLTALVTIFVAAGGWWYSTVTANFRSRQLKTFALRAGEKGVDGVRPIIEKIQHRQNIVQADLDELGAKIADLDLMVEGLPQASWPSPGAYIAGRALRDRVFVLKRWMELDGEHRDDFWSTSVLHAQSIEESYRTFVDQARAA